MPVATEIDLPEAHTLLDEFQERDRNRTRIPLDLTPGALRFGVDEKDGSKQYLVVDGEPYPLSEDGKEHLSIMLGVDKTYYKRADLAEQEWVLNHRLDKVGKQSADSPNYVVPIGFAATEVCPATRLGAALVDGIVTGLADLDHVRVPAWEVIEQTARLVEDGKHPVYVRTNRWDSNTVTVDFVTAAQQVAVRVGDPTWAGIRIVHNDMSTGVTQLSSLLYRLVCTNGMQVPHNVRMTRLSVGRHGEDEAVQKYLEMLGGATQKHWDNVQGLLNDWAHTDSYGPPDFDAIREIGAIPAPPNVRDMISRQYQQDPMGGTYYGFLNAVTAVAHHEDVNSAVQDRLETMAGQWTANFIRRCPTCTQKLPRQRAERGSRGTGEVEAVVLN